MLSRGTVASLTCAVVCWAGIAHAQQPEAPQLLVREVVYNELRDHDTHGNWRYWIKKRVADGTQISEQVETHDGPVTRIVLHNDEPVSEDLRRSEQVRLDGLANSTSEQSGRRQAYAEDEKRVGRILAMLPEAFLFDDAGEIDGCRHLRFRPNPAYPAKGIETRVFHALTGELWLDARMKRMVKLEGHMDEDLTFGYGILGRVYKGSWFRMDRMQVSLTEWKTNRLEMHMSGRAMMFKTIAKETSEVRGGFSPVPGDLSLAQGARMLRQSQPGQLIAHMSPATYVSGK